MRCPWTPNRCGDTKKLFDGKGSTLKYSRVELVRVGDCQAVVGAALDLDRVAAVLGQVHLVAYAIRYDRENDHRPHM